VLLWEETWRAVKENGLKIGFVTTGVDSRVAIASDAEFETRLFEMSLLSGEVIMARRRWEGRTMGEAVRGFGSHAYVMRSMGGME